MLYLSMLRAVATTTTAAEKEKEVEVEVELEVELEEEVVVESMPPPMPPPSFGRAMSISTNGHQLEQYLLELKESMRRSPSSVSGSGSGSGGGVSGGGVSGASGDSLGTSSSSGGGATRTLSNEFHQMRRRQSISNVDLTKFEDQEVEEWLVRIYFFIIIYFCFLHFELATMADLPPAEVLYLRRFRGHVRSRRMSRHLRINA